MLPEQENRLKVLLRQYAKNNSTELEIKEMFDLLMSDEEDTVLEAIIYQLKEEQAFDEVSTNLKINWEKVWNTIRSQIVLEHHPTLRINWPRFLVAASLLLIINTGIYFLIQENHSQQTAHNSHLKLPENDIQPGGNKAILTLSDGSEIILDSAKNGKLTLQGNTEIVKLKNGQISYNSSQGNNGNQVYNMLTTPVGGTYTLTLPDGTNVWLNSISSIRYPTAFTGKERRVEITGEAYFEVAKNTSMPFKVIVNKGMEVLVTGTHFNINGYSDNPKIKTTLLEGSVSVKIGNKSISIQPGQQAQLHADGQLNIVNDVDLDEAVAWKNGYFQFHDTELKDVMREILRWYDIQVEYQGNITDKKYTAEISKNKSLLSILKIFQMSGVDFKLEGKKLIVK